MHRNVSVLTYGLKFVYKKGYQLSFVVNNKQHFKARVLKLLGLKNGLNKEFN